MWFRNPTRNVLLPIINGVQMNWLLLVRVSIRHSWWYPVALYTKAFGTKPRGHITNTKHITVLCGHFKTHIPHRPQNNTIAISWVVFGHVAMGSDSISTMWVLCRRHQWIHTHIYIYIHLIIHMTLDLRDGFARDTEASTSRTFDSAMW